MLIVPLSNDRIVLRGKDGTYLVSSYTGFKHEPSVYLKSTLPDGTRFIEFSEIIEVNGIPVDYQEDSKLLKALGPLKRIIHLPQKGDTICYTLVDTSFHKDEVCSEVLALKLHSIKDKTHSLQVKLENTMLSLASILDIKRDQNNTMKFSRAKFQKLYIDYFGV